MLIKSSASRRTEFSSLQSFSLSHSVCQSLCLSVSQSVCSSCFFFFFLVIMLARLVCGCLFRLEISSISVWKLFKSNFCCQHCESCVWVSKFIMLCSASEKEAYWLRSILGCELGLLTNFWYVRREFHYFGVILWKNWSVWYTQLEYTLLFYIRFLCCPPTSAEIKKLIPNNKQAICAYCLCCDAAAQFHRVLLLSSR